MFCSNCGRTNPDGSIFCSSCGSSQISQSPSVDVVEQIAPVIEAQPDGKKKLFGKKVLIGAGAVVAVLAALVVVFLPKSVAVEVGIVAPNGGVFDAACNVQADAEYLTPFSIEFSSSVDNTSPISSNISYALNSSGDCVGKASVSLSPFTTYYAFAGGDQIAELSPSDISSGKASVGTSISIVRDLRVNFNLYDEADRCTGSTESWNCWWDNDYIFGLKLNSDSGNCSGQNGFSDIRKGTAVKVVGRSNNQISTGSLIVDTYELVSVSSKQIVCKFYADFSSIPNDDLGYSITVSNRGSVDYDLNQVRDNSWVADLQLNQ
jgi:hypothetical protein